MADWNDTETVEMPGVPTPNIAFMMQSAEDGPNLVIVGKIGRITNVQMKVNNKRNGRMYLFP